MGGSTTHLPYLGIKKGTWFKEEWKIPSNPRTGNAQSPRGIVLLRPVLQDNLPLMAAPNNQKYRGEESIWGDGDELCS